MVRELFSGVEIMTPQAIETVPEAIEHEPRRKRFTRFECDDLRDCGQLIGRYELIEGDILDKRGQKPAHAYCIRVLMRCMIQLFGESRVLSQLPIRVAIADDRYNEPEPDVAVTANPDSAFTFAHPEPRDILLVAEVSDTSQQFDLGVKAALYARAEIREYWVIDLRARQVVTHRDPQSGVYRSIQAYNSEERVSTLAMPESFVQVNDLLPPADTGLQE